MIPLKDLLIKIGETEYVDLTAKNTLSLFDTYKFIYKSEVSGNCELILMFTDIDKEVKTSRENFIGKYIEISFKTLGKVAVNKKDGYNIKYSGVITDFYYSANYGNSSRTYTPDQYYREKLTNDYSDALLVDGSSKIEEIYTIVIKPDFFHKRAKQNKIYIDKSSLDIAKELINDFPKLDIDTNPTPHVPIRDFCFQYQNETSLEFFQRILSEDELSYVFVFDHKCENPKISIFNSTSRNEKNDIIIENNLPVTMETSYHDQIQNVKVFDHAIDTPDNDVSCEKVTLDEASRESNGLALSENIAGSYEEKTKKIDNVVEQYIKFEKLTGTEYIFIFENFEEILIMHPGQKLTLKSHDETREFIIKSVNLDYTFSKLKKNVVMIKIIALDAHFDFVPKIIQPCYIPLMSAKVIGNKDDNERYYKKDENSDYDSVKVKFHWETEEDENQYWLRIVQLWAGKSYGTFFRPTVGSEVIVSFLYGPNVAPVVLGCIHDGKTKFPSWLNTNNLAVKKDENDKRLNKFSSGIITKNEEDAAALYTELIFDDTKNQEKFSINTAKDYESTIQNNRDIYIMEGSDSVTINKGDESITLGEGSRTLDLKKGDESITLGEGSRTLDLKKGDESITLGKGTRTVKSKKQIFDVADEITLKCGSSQIVLKPNGIEIKSPRITLKAAKTFDAQSAKTTVKGTTMMEISGTMTKVQGSGILECLGGLVKIN
jgi:type VI secretion system secreted protein VgrG